MNIFVIKEGPKVRTLKEMNPDVVKSSFDFIYEDLSHPGLKFLRKNEKLDEVISPAKTEFEKILLLKKWVSTQWTFGTPEPYPPFDANKILEWIRSGKTIGWCGIYSIVFLQSCLSIDIQARFVELFTRSNAYCHFLTEVYLKDEKKWAVMDPTPGCAYFVRRGKPLSALEVHKAYIDMDYENVEPKVDEDTLKYAPSGHRKIGTKLGYISWYYGFRIALRQNQLSKQPHFVHINDTFDRYDEAVEWENPMTVPWEHHSYGRKDIPHRRMALKKTSRPEDLYWKIDDNVNINIKWLIRDRFVVYLNSNMPSTKNYEIKIDDGRWKPEREIFEIKFKSGVNRISARAKDTLNRLGRESYIEFRVG